MFSTQSRFAKAMVRGRKKKVLLSAILISIVFFLMSWSPLPEETEEIISGANYFDAQGDKFAVIDLPGCFIPMEEVEPILRKTEKIDCASTRPPITYVRGNKIFLNSSYTGAKCCYRGIIRGLGDNDVSKLDDCVNIGKEVSVELYDSVTVVCIYVGGVYDDYHALARKKVIPKNPNAPNVVLIGLDSVSRFHFRTLMPKTLQILNELGAVDLMGYTKVGNNTFPNAIAFLTGYAEDEALKFCYNRSLPMDACPFLWNNLNMATALLEDAPSIAIFNYFKVGFLRPPTTHYLRPLMLTVSQDNFPYEQMFSCVGSRRTETFMLEHVRQLMEHESPLFSFTWLTGLAHQNLDRLPEADLILSNFLLSLNLTNTVFVLMSDHGYLYENGRTSFNGWFNEKLPFVFISIPPKVKDVLGARRIQALQSNARKLTTPFDVYHTLKDILAAYDLKDFVAEQAMLDGKPFKRTHGQSLFSNISEDRSCADAGIAPQFCACTDLRVMDLNHEIVGKTARHSVSRINKWLPRRCRQLHLAQVTAAANLNGKEFIVGFTANPGDLKFEAIGNHDGKLTDSRISRVNKITNAWCVNDWFLELFCDCDPWGYFSELFLENLSSSKM